MNNCLFLPCKINVSLVAVVSIAILVLNCGSNEKSNDELSKIDITGAKILFISNNTLFKIGSDEAVSQVDIINTDQNKAALEYLPNAIFNVNSNYVIISFGYVIGDPSNNEQMNRYAYIVNKKTGAAYNLGDTLGRFVLNSQVHFINSTTVQIDNSNNIYYLVNNTSPNAIRSINKLIKLTVVDPTNLQKTVISDDSIDVMHYAVSNDGFVGYVGMDGSDSKIVKCGTVDSNGNRATIQTSGEEYLFTFWKAADGEVYYSKMFNVSTGGDYNIYAAKNGSLYKNLTYGIPFTQTSIVELFSKTAIIYNEAGSLGEIYNSSGILGNQPLTSYPISGIDYYATTSSSNDMIFIGSQKLGQYVLFECDSSYSCSQDSVVGMNKYQIINIQAIGKDELYVYARDVSSTTSFVIFKLVPNSSLTILKTLTNNDAIISFKKVL